MMNVIDVLDAFSKEQLVNLVIENSDNGWYPLELLLIKMNYNFATADLEKMCHGKRLAESN